MDDKFTIQEIIEIAIEIEKNGKSFYQSLSEQAGSAQLRDLFEYLSKEEELHINRFEELLKISGGYQISELYYATDYMGYMKAIADERVFKSNLSVNEFVKNIKSASEALDKAIGFEKDSILFLYEMQEFLDDKNNKGTIQKLINEEKDHIRRLSIIKSLVCK